MRRCRLNQVFINATQSQIKYAMRKHVKRRYYDTSHARIVHVTVIHMCCRIACDPECWESLAPHPTQPELEGLWILADPTNEFRRQKGEVYPAR